MKKAIMKCDRCGVEQEISSMTGVSPLGWLALSIETDLCQACNHAYQKMQETLSKIREEFFNGSRKTE
jgi:hypothetical protein